MKYMYEMHIYIYNNTGASVAAGSGRAEQIFL